VADRDLRDRERRSREGGDSEQAAWLQQRLRSGDLPRWRLRLAAALGHHAAALVVSRGRPEQAPIHDEVAWVLGLQLDEHDLLEGDEVLLRIAFALAAWALPRSLAPQAHADLVRAIGGFLLAPGEQTEQTLELLLGPYPGGAGWRAQLQPSGLPQAHAEQSLWWAADVVLVRADPQTGRGKAAARAMRSAFGCALLSARDTTPEGVEGAREQLRGVLVAALLPWALDEGEPVRIALEGL